ncbi:MAG TPA: DUF3306 domain-containing protein [Rubrivivax sp.]
MAAESEDSGFLARWSRRKVQVREGTPVAEPPAPAPAAVPVLAAAPAPSEVADADALPPADPPPPPPPLPTLADVAELTRDSDFSRFVARGVQPEVKNAALKKLFTDPHFNIMDGLDTYIDDYGLPDPLPEGMLRKMAQAKFLGLFSDEEKPSAEITPETAPDEDTDLRLQPHDDPGHAGPAPGAGQDTGREH